MTGEGLPGAVSHCTGPQPRRLCRFFLAGFLALKSGKWSSRWGCQLASRSAMASVNAASFPIPAGSQV